MPYDNIPGPAIGRRSGALRASPRLLALPLLLSTGCSSDIGDGSASFAAPSASVPQAGGGLPGASAPTPSIGTALPTAQPGSTADTPAEQNSAVPSGDDGTAVDYTPPTPEAPELQARAWRLTHEQYQTSIRELLGVEVDLANFVPEYGNGMFVNYSNSAFVRVDLADNYLDTARDVANSLSQQQLAALTSCDLAPACLDEFIQTLVGRAFRRPATPSDLERYRSLYDVGAAEGDTLLGYRAVIQGLLNSPNFLYRTEIGDEASETLSNFQLTDYEVASLLAYSLLDAPPPPALIDAAAAGELTNPATLPAHVEALLTQPAAQQQLRHFLQEWLEVHHFEQVDKFEDSYPGFENVKSLMETETEAFLAQSGSTESTLSNLLLDAVPSVGAALDQFYFSDPSAPATAERVGVLSLGTVLSHHAKAYLTSPTLRGTFVRKRFFCQEITLPPGFTPPPLSETEERGEAKSTRELYEQHQTDPTCSTCHRLTDNIGFVMEEYDGAGRFRTMDSTQGPPVPIDSTGDLTDSDVNRPMATVLDLAQAMSESELVRECVARQAYRFYFGQGESSRGQLPIIEGHTALQNSGRLGDLLAGLMSTPSTYSRERGAVAPGAAQ